jgi:hypothetical protein
MIQQTIQIPQKQTKIQLVRAILFFRIRSTCYARDESGIIGEVVPDPEDWNHVSSVIDKVVNTGTKVPYGKEPDIFQATKIVNGKEVVVRYTSGGQIGTAFVKQV